MDPLRVGVVGLGSFGESHLRAYRGLPNVEVVAVASRSADRASAVADQYGIARWYAGYGELIADPAIDAVSVTTAETEHCAPAVAALEAGKCVLVEKPMATTLADAEAMIEAARRSSGFLMPGHILRFERQYAGLKTVVATGELGTLTSLSARRNRPRGLVATHGRVHPALVTAIHDVDVMLWLTGDRVRSVRAVDRLADRDEGAHGLWALLQFERGTVALLETAWMLPDGSAGDDAFEAIGTLGTAAIDAPDLRYEDALAEELAYFAGCARSGTKPAVVTPDDGLAALAVVLAAIESAGRDAEVEVGLKGGDR